MGGRAAEVRNLGGGGGGPNGSPNGGGGGGGGKLLTSLRWRAAKGVSILFDGGRSGPPGLIGIGVGVGAMLGGDAGVIGPPGLKGNGVSEFGGSDE